ncbi:MAG: hypothetical protein JO033_13765 [Acidobacteriaceae bacterium]|nr:hypothetical protein [Acidobacteriaceae bacterium]MBV9501426.1 hypothetical protein [Acidobacteriaceae bacterium]
MQAAVAAQSWEIADTSANRVVMRLLPSLTDFVFLLPSFLLFCMLPGTTVLLGDGDTGWHIRTGEWILQHRTVPRVDLFSFTKAHQPWFAWEWGWDLIFAVIHGRAGLAGVAFVTIALLSFISALLFRLIRRYSDSDVLAFALTIVAICGSMIHWLARPHLVSWLFALIFSHLILSAEEGKTKALYVLPVLMCLWVNLHGGFFVGLALLVTAACGKVLNGILRADSLAHSVSSASPFAISTLLCALATLINPYGWRLHQHIFSYLSDSKLLDNINEYQSISFHRGTALFFECMLLLGIASLGWCVVHRKLGDALSIVLWAHLGLVSGRNIPFYLLVAAPPIACMLRDAFSGLRSFPALARIGEACFEIGTEFQRFERVERWYPASASVVLVVALLLGSNRPAYAAQFKPENFPVTAMPKLEDVQFSRVFTYDQWADYLIYVRYPSQKVFMDDRTDFYGSDFVTEYQHIVSARYDCEALLKRYGIDAVLIRPDEALATVLKHSPDWVLLFDDGKAAIFKQRSDWALTPAQTGASPLLTISSRSRDGGRELGRSWKVDARVQQ